MLEYTPTELKLVGKQKGVREKNMCMLIVIFVSAVVSSRTSFSLLDPSAVYLNDDPTALTGIYLCHLPAHLNSCP